MLTNTKETWFLKPSLPYENREIEPNRKLAKPYQNPERSSQTKIKQLIPKPRISKSISWRVRRERETVKREIVPLKIEQGHEEKRGWSREAVHRALDWNGEITRPEACHWRLRDRSRSDPNLKANSLCTLHSRAQVLSPSLCPSSSPSSSPIFFSFFFFLFDFFSPFNWISIEMCCFRRLFKF